MTETPQEQAEPQEERRAPRIQEAPLKCQRCGDPLNVHKGWPEWCPKKPYGQAGGAIWGSR